MEQLFVNMPSFNSMLRQASVHSLPIHQGQDVEHGGNIRVIMSRRLLQVLQGLFAEGHGHLVPALRGVLDHQVVECPEAGGDLVASLLGCHLSAWLGCGTEGRISKHSSHLGFSVSHYFLFIA